MRSDILEILRVSDQEYVSGESIAMELGISRAAVWKHIKELRKMGYDIVSQPHCGYKLCRVPDCLLPAEIKHGLQTKCFGHNIYYREEVTSTNDEAKKLASSGAEHGSLVICERQGAGRGRLSRGWFSPSGRGLWFSLILRPSFLPQDAPLCTLLAALALVEALPSGYGIGIKWPNDIFCKGRKLAGVLTEMNAEMDCVHHIVVGIGLNVNLDREAFPSDLADIATSVQSITGQEQRRVPLLQHILSALEALYDDVEKNGFQGIIEKWKKHNVTLGREVIVSGVKENFVGKAVDIAPDGALLVQAQDGVHRVLAGDVSLRPVSGWE